MGIVIDTGVFIRWERDGEVVDLGGWARYGEPAISVITQSELLIGVHRVDTTERREKQLRFVDSIIANVALLPVDSRIAEVHARIVAALGQAGTMIGPHDNWISATAIAYDYELLTTNAVEFKRVAGLRVVDYLSTI